MKASQIERCADGAVLRLSWMFSQSMASKARTTLRGPRQRDQLGPRLLCIGLWLSSALAILMSHGLLALFMSGQALAAGDWLFKNLVRTTRRLGSGSSEPDKHLAGAFDEL